MQERKESLSCCPIGTIVICDLRGAYRQAVSYLKYLTFQSLSLLEMWFILAMRNTLHGLWSHSVIMWLRIVTSYFLRTTSL